MPERQDSEFTAAHLAAVDPVLRFFRRRLASAEDAGAAARTVFSLAYAADVPADPAWLILQCLAVAGSGTYPLRDGPTPSAAHSWGQQNHGRNHGRPRQRSSTRRAELRYLACWERLDAAVLARIYRQPRWLIRRNMSAALTGPWPPDPAPVPVALTEARALLAEVEEAGVVLDDNPARRPPAPVPLSRPVWPAAAAVGLIGAGLVAGLAAAAAGLAGGPSIPAAPGVTAGTPAADYGTAPVGPGPMDLDAGNALLPGVGPFNDWTRVQTLEGTSFELPPGWRTLRRSMGSGPGTGHTLLQDAMGVTRAALFRGSGSVNLCYPEAEWSELYSTPLDNPSQGGNGPGAAGAHVSVRALEMPSGVVQLLAVVNNDPAGPEHCASLSVPVPATVGNRSPSFVTFTTNYPVGMEGQGGSAAPFPVQFSALSEALVYSKSADYALLVRAMASLQYGDPPPAAQPGDCRISTITANRNSLGITTANLSTHPEYFMVLGCAGGWLAFEVSNEGFGHVQSPTGGLIFYLARHQDSGWVFDTSQPWAVMDGWLSAAITGQHATPAGATAQQRMDTQFAAAGVPVELREALIGSGP